MIINLRKKSHSETEFVRFDPHLCQACWKCLEACPQGVLGRVQVFGHRHAHVDHAEKCKGCQQCLRACPTGALSRRMAE